VHDGADQWLYVICGTGTARVKRSRYKLVAGTLLFIEHGESERGMSRRA
jgi:hypothetical protein